MACRNALFEVEKVEQLALIARLPPHHGSPCPLIPPPTGISVRSASRALFQQHRPTSDSGNRAPPVNGSPAEAPYLRRPSGHSDLSTGGHVMPRRHVVGPGTRSISRWASARSCRALHPLPASHARAALHRAATVGRSEA